MRAILVTQSGGPQNLQMGEWEQPVPGPREVLVKVAATALNRADILQRRGKYPPPEGASPLLGLEMSGEVVEVGAEVTRWKVGDPLCGLLPGGGYAAYAVIHEDLAMPVLPGLDLVSSAAIPEVFLTAFQGLVWLGKLKEGEKLLIHAGASGVGTAAIQIARQIGAEVFVTASAAKHATCLALGANKAIDYRAENFQERIEELTEGSGVDVILDVIGGPYFDKNLGSLRLDGRLVLLALMGGIKPLDGNLFPILRKRLQITGSTLRNRTQAYKIALSQAFFDFAEKRFAEGKLKPVIDRVFPWEEVAEAHTYMEANKNIGKILLKVSE
ncbi:MAG: NAD(P)H-quinone oxidoreductase [Bacteroidota bacterium]